MCGGTARRLNRARASIGLSPRVRGNRNGKASLARRSGSIPACAGEPTRPPPAHTFTPVYPRVCGGTAITIPAAAWRSGLSPRVRGNLLPGAHQPLRPRSIPACAGEPPPPASPPTALWVYPRVCGGTLHFGATGDTASGLSPRVRGNQFGVDLLPGFLRSIPACAGEPGIIPKVPYLGQVYPRVCGGTLHGCPRPAG